MKSQVSKEKAIDYIKEFRAYQSNINGSGGLPRYLDNYEEWLFQLEEDVYQQELIFLFGKVIAKSLV